MKKLHGAFWFSIIAAALAPHVSLGWETRALEGPVRNDFAISPAKFELSIAPGKTATRALTVANRHARSLDFTVSVEDVTGSNDPKDPVIIGSSVGGGMKNFIHPEIASFRLGPNEGITFSVAISLPEDVTPGGKYGSVIVSTVAEGGAATRARPLSRLAALFFVRVEGETKEEGVLEIFRLREKKAGMSFEKHFEVYYKNTGNVHLIPYGRIDIKNMFGKNVQSLVLDPYFALPNSTRYREVAWEGKVLPGRYTATVLLNRGYGNIVDEKTISFWIFPQAWMWGVLATLAIILLVWKSRRRT